MARTTLYCTSVSKWSVERGNKISGVSRPAGRLGNGTSGKLVAGSTTACGSSAGNPVCFRGLNVVDVGLVGGCVVSFWPCSSAALRFSAELVSQGLSSQELARQEIERERLLTVCSLIQPVLDAFSLSSVGLASPYIIQDHGLGDSRSDMRHSITFSCNSPLSDRTSSRVECHCNLP